MLIKAMTSASTSNLDNAAEDAQDQRRLRLARMAYRAWWNDSAHFEFEDQQVLTQERWIRVARVLDEEIIRQVTEEQKQRSV